MEDLNCVQPPTTAPCLPAGMHTSVATLPPSLVRGSAKPDSVPPFLKANAAGADEALMLDPHGFVATCNSTNFCIVRSHIDIWGERQSQVGVALDRPGRLATPLAAGAPPQPAVW